MPPRRVRTAAYPPEARARLGDAVAKAREAAGFKSRTSFARWASIKSMRSLDMVENGEPGVGQTILFAIGRALPGWNEDTPRTILEGGPAPRPPTDDELRATLPADVAAEMEAVEIFQDPAEVGSDRWLMAAAELFDGDDLREVLRRGLEARKQRQELERFLLQAAERVQPEGARHETSQVD
jgi:hypothetical protein